jgi:hypothetical protein
MLDPSYSLEKGEVEVIIKEIPRSSCDVTTRRALPWMMALRLVRKF